MTALRATEPTTVYLFRCTRADPLEIADVDQEIYGNRGW